MTHDVRLDVNKPNDARKISFPLNLFSSILTLLAC